MSTTAIGDGTQNMAELMSGVKRMLCEQPMETFIGSPQQPRLSMRQHSLLSVSPLLAQLRYGPSETHIVDPPSSGSPMHG